MRNSYYSETQLVDVGARAIRDRLPPGWRLGERGREIPTKSEKGLVSRIDAIWEIRDPNGISSDVVVEVKRSLLEPRMVLSASHQLKELAHLRYQESGEGADAPALMLISNYLSPLARERLTESGINYADSTGNIRFAVNRPAIFIETQGAVKNPFREERPLRSLKGGRAARVARGLLDYQPPFGTRELAAKIASSPAMVSRVSGLLEPDEIVTKEGPRGRIVSVYWEALARRWAEDYDLATSNTVSTWLEPRGAKALFGRLRHADFRYSVTGSFAAYRIAPFAEPRLAALYADDPESAALSLGLRPAETGGNVLVMRPFDPVVYERAGCADGIAYARVTQVLVDLMKGPGRGPEEAEALLEWMRNNEEEWKLPMTEAI